MRKTAKLPPNGLQPATILTQIRVAEAGSGANLYPPLLTIQQEFPVIDEKGSTEFNAQVTGALFGDRGISPKGKCLFQAGKGRTGIIAENEWGDTMPFVDSLTRHTIG